MDRELLEDHLVKAERHVFEGGRHINRQREIIEMLERQSHDAGEARRLLRQFEELQALHVAGRDRLRRELGLVAPINGK
jgi:hypothetical protein